MPVVFKCTGTLFPNKPNGGVGNEVKFKIPLLDIVHKYQRPHAELVHILRPKIDRLTVLLNVQQLDARAAFVQALIDIKDDENYHYVDNPNTIPKSLKYKVSVRVKYPSSDSPIIIQAGPLGKTVKHFLRLDFNPSAIGAGGLQFLRDFLSDYMLGDYTYSHWLETGRISRVDVACDFINAQIGDLLFRSIDGGKTHGYYSDAGDLQTVYLGMKSSDKASKFYAYDKATEQSDKGQQLSFSGAQHTRVEFKVISKQPLKNLKSIPSPLDQLEVYDCFAVKPPVAEHHWLHFLDSCRHRGIENALAFVPEPKRGKYDKALKQALHNAWPTEKLWSYWHDVIDKIGLLDPN